MRATEGIGKLHLHIGAFPLAVVGMVGIMILPLPTILLDSLVMLNVALAIVLLVAVVYLREPERFTTLPAILLLATLFRLGLNVSTTRTVLSEGEAPSMIVAFGEFVVHGNILVGMVVFLIITLVQFLVIAKGAERVAEVAARFALDAMPGRQMAIDGDVRSGLLSSAEARKRREQLQRESKLYGSLDGAMKFVKGDAIAGLCITLVNIVGGFVLGVFQHNLTFIESFNRFTLFAIGDGLASQIPALLVSVAAGVAVTRVSGEEQLGLGDDVVGQLTSDPRGLATSGVVFLLLGCTPGVMGWPFWTMGALALCAASCKEQRQTRQQERSQDAVFQPQSVPGFLLRLSPCAVSRLQQEQELPQLVQQLRARIFEESGLYLQDMQFEICSQWTSQRIELAYQGEMLIEVHGEHTSPDARTVSLSAAILGSLATFVEKRGVELIDDTQVRLLFEIHRATCEDLIHALTPSRVPVTELTAVLRALREERVSFRNFARVLQAITDCELELQGVGAGRSAQWRCWQRVGYVRQALRMMLCRDLSAGAPLSVVYLDGELDCLFTDFVAAQAPLDPELAARLQEEALLLKKREPRAVLVCSKEARPLLSHLLLDGQIPIAVLAQSELCPTVSRVVVGTFGLAGIQPQEQSTQPDAHWSAVEELRV